MRNICVLAILFMVVLPGFAADVNHDGFETILLPVAFHPGTTVAGAYGTQWQGETWVSNTSDTQEVALEYFVSCAAPPCWPTYPPRFVGVIEEPPAANADRGFLLTPTSDRAPLLHFSNRMFEVSRHAQPQGFELPVVREDQFLSSPTELVGIPASSAARVAIRVYDPRLDFSKRKSGVTVRLDVRGADDVLLGSTTLTTTYTDVVGSFSEYQRPGFAAIYDLASAIPAVNTAEHIHVTVTPLTPDATFWVMASVTDNDTQQVLIVTPQ